MSNASLEDRIRSAWQGRVSGCQLGKPVESLSMQKGHAALSDYLIRAEALPLRDYVPAIPGTQPGDAFRSCCRDHIERSEPDDDIHYTVLALELMEDHGLGLDTAAVARAWLRKLPVAWTFTAERAAYKILLERAHEFFCFGVEPGFDLAECSDNEWNDWIGAQIRADLYGWVCPGRPSLAADLARRDASLSHRAEGVHGAVYVAALGAAIPEADSLEDAVARALEEIPSDSDCAEAVALGRAQAGKPGGDDAIRERYAGVSPVHTINNLALVVWSLLSHPDDYGAAVGDVVAAGWDTDCNGATVGGLWGLQGKPIPEAWTKPWQGRIAVMLAGKDELSLDDLVQRTVAVTERIAREA